jgi:hypothetical protein
VFASSAGRPRTADGRPGATSYLRQLARLNQVDEHIPLVLGQDRQIAGLPHLHLLPSKLHLRARAAPGWAQQHLPILKPPPRRAVLNVTMP